MTNSLLESLNKMGGVLGCAWVDGDEIAFELGEAIGGVDAVPYVKQAAVAFRTWISTHCPEGEGCAMFVGDNGRILTQSAGAGVLVAFVETSETSGLLKVRMREVAAKLAAETAAV
jgi:predicted regulator of Ras-like GTPase activity (Roadblock/LC7/MglB family)